MALFDPIIPARYFTPLLALLRGQLGERIDAALAGLGFNEQELRHPDKILTISQFDALITTFSALSGRDDLGFELGLAIKIHHHQSLGQALLRCETADQLLRLLARFSRLVTPVFSLQYERNADGGVLIWRPAAFMSPLTLRALEEVFAVSVHTELKEALGQRMGRADAYLSMPSPPHLRRYAALRPTRFSFGAQALPEVKFVFDAAMLDTPLWPVDQAVTAAMVDTLQQRQRSIARHRNWAQWVQVILREAEGCQPSREELAQLLNVSPTSLTRQLASEACNLRQMGRQIRHERACAMLLDKAQPITQIAYRLGYRDGANFSHAFRKESGLTPMAYRAGLSRPADEFGLNSQVVA